MDPSGARRSLDVLVVDDEPALAALVAANLAARGHRVRTAADGRAGLAAVAASRPDVVVLDVLMPLLDGWGVLEALAEDPATAELPVVMLTALAGEQDVIRAHLTGAVQYLTKPFDISTLLTEVVRAAEPPTEDERDRRRTQLRGFLGRLAELDAGRDSEGRQVRFAGLEPIPPPAVPPPLPRTDTLTSRQLLVAGLLADGVSPRQIASQLGTSRSNFYATRARIGRHLGTDPEAVAETARRVGLSAARPAPPRDGQDTADAGSDGG